MSTVIFLQKCNLLDRTIKNLCVTIEKRINDKCYTGLNEYDLRKEIIACILGSQVHYKMATIALLHLENAKLLDDKWWNGSCNNFVEEVHDVLAGNKIKCSKKWSYRFPNMKAIQLSKVRDILAERQLSSRINFQFEPQHIRKQLVTTIPGIGPKQASMFLRNVGVSYDLAILDTHVLDFMIMKKMLCSQNKVINSLKTYENIEKIMVKYANEIGSPVGYIDWAIWVTMKAAKELKL